MANDTIKFKIGQVLSDKNSKGKERPWREHKYHAMVLGKSFRRIYRVKHSIFRRKDKINYSRRADRADMCGNSLGFVVENNRLRLAHAKFCQISLCPMCAWRKSRRISHNVSLVASALQDEGYRLIMATFTVKNVSGQDLKAQLAELTKSFNKLTKYKQFKASVKGFFRALEITHDTKEYITNSMYQNAKAYYDSMGLSAGDKNPNFGMYHPHFHVLLAVKESYFQAKYYIEQGDFAKMWQKALKANYMPVVDVRAIKGSRKDINEVAKYTTKSGDYLIGERDEFTSMLVTVDEPLTDSAVEVLSEALHKRRLVGWGGVFDEMRKKLGLEEEVEAAADAVDDEQPVKLNFRWFGVGFNNYKLTQIVKDCEMLEEIEIKQKQGKS